MNAIDTARQQPDYVKSLTLLRREVELERELEAVRDEIQKLGHSDALAAALLDTANPLR